jgi:hypothetical protein
VCLAFCARGGKSRPQGALRTCDTRTCNAARPDSGCCPPHSSSIKRSDDTVSLALSNSSANSARCFAPASRRTEPPSAT